MGRRLGLGCFTRSAVGGLVENLRLPEILIASPVLKYWDLSRMSSLLGRPEELSA